MTKKVDPNHPAAKYARARAYFQTCLEHVERLNRCYAAGEDPAMAIYLAGLCVECMLRAFRSKFDPEFDSRHNLLRLAELSQIAAVVPAGEASQRYAECIGRLAVVWSSNDRFETIAGLTKRMRDIGYKPKSDTLGHVADVLYEDAQWLIGLGREHWK